MWRVYIRQHPTFGPWYSRVERQPSWVVKAAITAAILVVVVPLALLTLSAILVGLFIFILLSVFLVMANLVAGVSRHGGHFSDSPDRKQTHDDGRRNVRVIHRQ